MDSDLIVDKFDEFVDPHARLSGDLEGQQRRRRVLPFFDGQDRLAQNPVPYVDQVMLCSTLRKRRPRGSTSSSPKRDRKNSGRGYLENPRP